MNEKMLGSHFELTSVPIDLADAVDEWICEFPLGAQTESDDGEPSWRDVVRGLRQSSPEGIIFATRSIEASARILKIRDKNEYVTIQQACDLSVERYARAAFLLRQKKDPRLKEEQRGL